MSALQMTRKALSIINQGVRFPGKALDELRTFIAENSAAIDEAVAVEEGRIAELQLQAEEMRREDEAGRNREEKRGRGRKAPMTSQAFEQSGRKRKAKAAADEATTQAEGSAESEAQE